MRRERGVVAFGVLMLISATTILTIAVMGRREARDRPARGMLQDGTELVAVLAVASTCGFSTSPALPAAVAEATTALAKQAEQEGKHFVYVGVGLDDDPVEGFRFLRHFGPFDEVLVGRGWLNMGSMAFMIRGIPGSLATPQLIVIERDIVAEENSISVTPDRIIRRYVGLDAIRQVQQDLKLPG